MQLVPFDGIPVSNRRRVLAVLSKCVSEWQRVLDIETAIHAVSTTCTVYMDKAQEVVHNIRVNPALQQEGATLVLMTDERLARDTIIEDIEYESVQRRIRFDQIVQEKYDMVNSAEYHSAIKCRRCGSGDVNCEQKQTRSADEAMTGMFTLYICTHDTKSKGEWRGAVEEGCGGCGGRHRFNATHYHSFLHVLQVPKSMDTTLNGCAERMR